MRPIRRRPSIPALAKATGIELHLFTNSEWLKAHAAVLHRKQARKKAIDERPRSE